MKRDEIVNGGALLKHAVDTRSTLAFLDAVLLIGGPDRAMASLGLDKGSFMELAAGSAIVTERLAERIYAATGGAVGKAKLCPEHSVIREDDTSAQLFVEGAGEKGMEYLAAVSSYVAAFREAERDPRVATYRRCVEAADHMLLVAART